MSKSNILKLKKPRTVRSKSEISIIKYTKSGERLSEGKIISLIGGVAFHVPVSFIGQGDIGVTLDDFRAGERLAYIEYGTVTSRNYKFTQPFGKVVWIGCEGMPTDAEPETCDTYKIGYTINETSFFLTPKDYVDNK